MIARLRSHPSTPPGPVTALAVEVHHAGERLHLRYRLHADPTRLRIPPPAAARFTLGLWEHTCFEAFVAAAAGDVPYHELNFSPSGEWAAFAFARYREIASLDIERCAPRIRCAAGSDGLELEARIDLAALAPAYAGGPLHLGLAAVVEEEGGALSYWALRHPAEKADFHHHGARTLHLPACARGEA